MKVINIKKDTKKRRYVPSNEGTKVRMKYLRNNNNKVRTYVPSKVPSFIIRIMYLHSYYVPSYAYVRTLLEDIYLRTLLHTYEGIYYLRIITYLILLFASYQGIISLRIEDI